MNYRADDQLTRVRLIRDAADWLRRDERLRNVGLQARTEMARTVVDSVLSVERDGGER